jgi:replicative DNA helicase
MTQNNLLKSSINFNEELERDIIGICLLEPITAIKVAQNVHEDWFYYDLHKDIFSTIRKRIADFKNIDAITVTEDLVEKYQSREIQGQKVNYLVARCFKDVVSGAHIMDWIEILKKLFDSRQLEAISAYSAMDMPISLKIAKIEAIMKQAQIVKHKTNWVGMGDVIEKYLKFYHENQGRNVVGYEIGLGKLDWLTGGWRKQTLTIVGARPSIGKSVFGLQAILKMTQAGLKVGVVNIEMSNNETMSRMLSSVSNIDFSQIHRLKIPYEDIINEVQKLKDLNIFFSDETKCTIEGIRASVLQLIGEHALDAVVIDYLQLMSVEEKTNTKNDEVGKITFGLKALAKMLDIPIIALSQLNRAGSGKPALEHLRDSGNIEQDADVVIFLHGDRELDDRLAIVAKNRNGKLGEVNLKLIGENMKFVELETFINQDLEQTF